MKSLLVLATAVFATAPLLSASPTLTEVATFPDQQVTGIAVSKTGRIFVNFPNWEPGLKIAVAEVLKDGSSKAYPNMLWNAPVGDPEGRFVCVQSVYIDDTDALWILDPAAPMLEKVVKGGAKLLKIDLATDKVIQTILFDDTIAPERSYLNDMRIDTKNQRAYLSESGVGSLVVVDLKTGKSRRVLEGHASTKAEPDKSIVVDGMKLIDPKTGTAPQFQVDGIALDTTHGIFYFHALAGRTLYKIATADLDNEALTEEELGAKVVKVAETPAPDGMIADAEGRIYLTAIEEDAIVRFDPATHKIEPVIQDKRLQWPDSLSWGADGSLYVTTSQIHQMAKFHGGKSPRTESYHVYKFKPE